MLKDVADSKRVNGNIRNMPAQAMSPLRRQRRETPVTTTSATVISALFWPALPVSHNCTSDTATLQEGSKVSKSEPSQASQNTSLHAASG